MSDTISLCSAQVVCIMLYPTQCPVSCCYLQRCSNGTCMDACDLKVGSKQLVHRVCLHHMLCTCLYNLPALLQGAKRKDSRQLSMEAVSSKAGNRALLTSTLHLNRRQKVKEQSPLLCPLLDLHPSPCPPGNQPRQLTHSCRELHKSPQVTLC